MGLDNGIAIRKENLNSSIILNESFIPLDYEVCYWRKCWGIRDDIIHYLRETYKTQENLYEYELTLEDLQAIYNILLSWYNKKKWNESGRSIWSWKVMKKQLRYDCNKLAYLIAKKEVYGDDLPVYFYDSY